MTTQQGPRDTDVAGQSEGKQRGQRIAISGASGAVGSRLVPFLTAAGYEVTRLVRRDVRRGDREVAWDPARGALDPAALEGMDAVVNLSGESVAAGKWTPERKRAIHDSRTGATALLARTLVGMRTPPRVFVSASAIGIYGDRGEELLTEESPPGRGFLAEVARDWEAAAVPATEAGIRVAHPRIGVVLMADAGVLERLVPPFRLGVGGPIGKGEQWTSWIHVEDLLRVILHLISTEHLAGAVNAVAPNPVRNRELAQSLGHALHRPAMVPAPEFAVKLMLGAEAAEEMVLASQRIVPKRLEADGFQFRYPTIDEALRAELEVRDQGPGTRGR